MRKVSHATFNAGNIWFFMRIAFGSLFPLYCSLSCISYFLARLTRFCVGLQFENVWTRLSRPQNTCMQKWIDLNAPCQYLLKDLTYLKIVLSSCMHLCSSSWNFSPSFFLKKYLTRAFYDPNSIRHRAVAHATKSILMSTDEGAKSEF